MKTHPQYARRLCHALDRLRKSKTRLTRQRARNALRSTLRAIQRELLEAFPPLADDGAARKVGKRWRNCPVCGAPFKTSDRLLEHLRSRHQLMKLAQITSYQGKIVRRWSCFCGCKTKITAAGMVRHLEANGWKAHIALHALRQVGNAV